MTIEELKAEWGRQLQTVEYQQDHRFMKDSINKLIAVAEAAKNLEINKSPYNIRVSHLSDLVDALNNLLEGRES